MPPTEDRTPVIRRTSSVFPRGQRPLAGTDRGVAGGATPYDQTPRVPAPTWSRPMGTDEERAEQRQANERAQTEQIYVNGRLVTVYNLFDAEGNPIQVETLGGYRSDGELTPVEEGQRTLSPGQRREYEGREGARQRTFEVLGINDVDQAERFIMSRGEQLDEDGTPYYSTDRGRAMVEDRLVKRRAPKSPNRTGATNMMTVAGGVTWFRNLSRTDPAAYAEMVDLLVGSGYLPEDAARKGVYSRDVGRAFAYAAADAAENVKAGSDEDLRTFLQKVRGEVSALQEQQEAEGRQEYQPVNRSYIDPAALAQTARAAAEEMLGRSLTDEEAQRFASKFRGLEDGYYDQIDAAGRAEGAARVADPNATGQADAFLRAPEFDDERTKQLTGNYMDALNQLLGG